MRYEREGCRVSLKIAEPIPRSVHIGFWLVLTVFWFATLGQRALIHPDEGRYAELSLGMLQSGDWVTPRLNGILYFEKPAFQYWMGALSFLAFGINEFAARFWPGLAGLLSVLAVGATARRLWGSGHYAALVMAGSVWVIANSHFLNLDSGLTFFLTLTLCSFLWAQGDDASAGERRYGMCLAWAAMAGATLSKGLIGVLIPGCTVVLYSLINRQWAPWRRMEWLRGISVFLVLSAPWFWMVSERNPGFAHFFFVHEHFERFLNTGHRREGPIWYFVPILFFGLLPWTSLLPRMLQEAWPRRRDSIFQAERFLLIWALFVFIFFSLSASKLSSYILPMFPALALLLGQTLTSIQPAGLKKHLWLPGIVWGLLAGTYFIADRFTTPDTPLAVVQHFSGFLTMGGLGFLLGAALAWRFLSRDRILLSVMLLSAGSIWGVCIGSLGHDSYGQLKSSKRVVEQVTRYLRQDMDIFSVRTYDQTFPFYLRRPVIQVDFRDEFEFGQKAEPGKAIPTISAFVTRWQSVPQAMAMMDTSTYQTLLREGLAMKLVYQDSRRVVAIKP